MNNVLGDMKLHKESIKSYSWTFIFTFIIILILFLKLDIYPFGDHFFRFLDGEQYYGYYGYLQDSFFSNSNLIYSWSSTLGNGMLSTYAYYASSPLNFILILFKNNLILGITFITVLRTLLTAFFFCTLLNYLHKGYDIEKGIFASTYAFIGYTALFSWNASWMDGVAILPLVILGIIKIFRKEGIFLYIISISCAMFSNFYIGYMLCITSGIFYVVFSLYSANSRSILENIKKTFVPYLLSSISAVGISAVLFIPAYLGVPKTRALSFKQILNENLWNFNLLQFCKMFFTNSARIIDSSNNLPIIFVGIISTVLVFAFFANKEILLKKKIAAGAILIILVVSFAMSVINIAWHGFSKNIWFNYRYSFIMSFVLILIAFESLISIKNAKTHIIAEGLFVLLIVVAICNDNSGLDNKSLVVDFVISLLSVGLILIYRKKAGRIIYVSMIILAVINILNMANNFITVAGDGTMQSSAFDYFVQKNKIAVLDDYMDADTIERVVDYNPYGGCESSQFNYAGVENFASTERVSTLETMIKLGMRSSWMRTKYVQNVPKSTDSLLGIKYFVTDDANNSKNYNLIENYDENTFIYKNENALPIIYKADNIPENRAVENDFELQNTVFSSSVNGYSDIFEKKSYDIVDGSIELDGKVNEMIYVQIPTPGLVLNVKAGSSENVIETVEGQEIYKVWDGDSDDKITLLLSDGEVDLTNIAIYGQSDDTVYKYTEEINLRSPYVSKKSSSRLNIIVENEADSCYLSTIPYDDCWKITEDGVVIDSIDSLGGFLAFNSKPGTHVIELKYIPRGLYGGAIISLISVLVVAVYGMYYKKRIIFHC